MAGPKGQEAGYLYKRTAGHDLALHVSLSCSIPDSSLMTPHDMKIRDISSLSLYTIAPLLVNLYIHDSRPRVL
jgi:hypothetical protein